jgi:CDP-4-dehydro-6-deoxyglucose reductase, E1
MQEILNQVAEFVKDKQSNKKWEAGKDLVLYAGPYVDEKESQAVVKAMLEGWLALGKEGSLFERRFPKKLGKKLGVLTNSGSSANLLMMLALTSKRGLNLPKGTKVITPIAGFPSYTIPSNTSRF